VTLAVPLAPQLALQGARPNPAVGAPQIAFTLPGACAAQLELVDVAGRRVAQREVGRRSPGRQVVPLGEGSLAPGLYWAELSHGSQRLRARVVVIR